MKTQLIVLKADVVRTKIDTAKISALISTQFLVQCNDANSATNLSVDLTMDEAEWLFGDQIRFVCFAKSANKIEYAADRAELGLQLNVEKYIVNDELIAIAVGPHDETVIKELMNDVGLKLDN